MYSKVFSVLSEEIILLVRLCEPAIELCRLSNIDDREKVSLETVRILYMPALTASTSLLWAYCLDGNPGDVLFSKDYQQHPSLHMHPQLSSSSLSEGRIDMHGHLHSVPMDGIVVILMHLTTLSGNFCKLELTVRLRTLLEFSNVQSQAGATETGNDTGVGTTVAVPWEKWGPNKTRILKHDSFLVGGSVVGERRAMLLQSHITIRDYNPFRVQRALKLFGGAEEVTRESGSVVKVVKKPSVYRKGEWFCDDIETSLPYVETAAPYDGHNEIIMDKDNLVIVPQLVRRETTQVNQAGHRFVHLLLEKMTD